MKKSCLLSVILGITLIESVEESSPTRIGKVLLVRI
jgi:hypothetical protein